MIAKLTGQVDSTGDGWAIIDVNGVGYLVQCSARTLDRLEPGAAASLQVETHVREDAFQLFGFTDAAERAWFRLLMTVQGVGARVALAILGVLPPAEISVAVAAGDRAAISRAPGVGPRLAARITSELKDKASPIAMDKGQASPTAPAGATGDAVAALVNLGFGASEALTAVSAASKRQGEAAGVEALIRDGLAQLAPRSDTA